jgi:hypothetical protein
MLYLAIFGFTRCFENRAIHVEVPAVVAATNPALLDTPVLKRRTTMGAVSVQETDAVAKIPEDHQILAEQLHRDGTLAKLHGHGHGVPEASHVLATWRTRTDMGQIDVLLQRLVDVVSTKGLIGPAGFFTHVALHG